MMTDIRCVCGTITTITVGQFTQCPTCKGGLSVTIVDGKYLDPQFWLGGQSLDERKKLGYPVKYKVPKIMRR